MMKMNSLILILLYQSLMFFVIILDVPIVRQIIGFSFLSFIPGYLILKFIKLNFKRMVDMLLFSVSLSITFLMFIGLFINALYPIFGIIKPLSKLNLLYTICISLLIISFIISRRKEHSDLKVNIIKTHINNKNRTIKLLMISSVPILSIFGSLFKNSYILLLMIVLIIIIVILTIFSKKIINPELHPYIIFIVAISLLFQKILISKYLIGWDVFGEFYVFEMTNVNMFWNNIIYSNDMEMLNYNSILSVTILPTIYSNLLNIKGKGIYDILYPIFYSLVPISLYQIYIQKHDKNIAFLSVFYFMLFPRFYSEERRVMIAEIFYSLLIYLMFDIYMNKRIKQFLTIIFFTSLIISYYTLSYIYLFIIFITWILINIIKNIKIVKLNIKSIEYLSGNFIILCFIIMFSWYNFISITPTITLGKKINEIYSSFIIDFFDPMARGTRIASLINPNIINTSILYKIDYIINKIPYFFIFIAFIFFFKETEKIKSNIKYFFIIMTNIFILILTIIVPYLEPAFFANRFYHITLFYIAPLCVLGGIISINWILLRFKKVIKSNDLTLKLMCVFLLIIFLFKVGFMNEITGDVLLGSRSISYTKMKLSSNDEIKTNLYNAYVPEQDVFSAMWLSEHKGKNSETYADVIAYKHVLKAYGMMDTEWKNILYDDTEIEDNAYIYLRYINVQGLLFDPIGRNIYSKFGDYNFSTQKLVNKIYSNGNSIIYRKIPNIFHVNIK